MSPADAALRSELVSTAQALAPLGLSQGSTGNISVRCGTGMLITPSATPYDTLQPGDLAAMALDGDGAWGGPLKPSSEWRFHRAILLARPEAAAVIHTHAPFCTTLAVARRAIPACHYMVAAFGGDSVRCAPYATFGTAELADLALVALAGRHACLLANHGMIVAAPSLPRALWLAVELEALARQYYQSLQIGGPCLLTAEEMADAHRAFAGYGHR